MIQLFFLHGELVAEQPAKKGFVHAQLRFPAGKGFFCPICAELWFTALVSGRETYIEHILCERHPASPSRPLPGSLWLSWDNNWNAALPQVLLEREILLLTKELIRNAI